jgi:glutathione S-transferase
VIKEVVKEVIVEKVSAGHSLNLKSKPTLGYWNIRGLGAQIRYLLYYCGVEFEDKMYAAGPAPDFDRSMWLNEKFTLDLEFPNLPYLVDEDAKVTETTAIMKYICAKWAPELLNKDPVTLANTEMMSAFVGKLKETATVPCYMGKSNQEIMDECWPLI